jgi:LuxR family maltose regulon positive regulatory protein
LTRSVERGGSQGVEAVLEPPVPVRALVEPIIDAKLHPPQLRPDWVARPRLLQELDEAVLRPVVLVAAPAGFGKTTLITQWLADDSVPATSAWVSLDGRDDDPDRLLTHVSLALELAGCRPPGQTGGVTDLLRAMDTFGDELVLVLDDFHVLQDPACHRQVELLVQDLPENAHLVISTRADPGLRLGRLRAAGRLGELRAADLAFTPAEAAAMLTAEHEHLSEQALYDLVERTEGWAAGLYLATLSMSGRTDPDEFVREMHGGNRFIGDYLTEEVLASHSPEVREFIKEVSILEQFSASLCDAVTGKAGSVRILRDLERTNLFLVPLDESRTWFRFHHLLASVAGSELEFEHPERIPLLHARAAHWFEDHGLVEEAATHSLASGSTDEAGRLVQANWLNYVDAGGAATVQGWLQALGPSALEDPLTRVPAAWLAALSGDVEGLEEHLRALEQVEGVGVGPLADGSRSVESTVCLIRGMFGYDGPIVMARNVSRALELETDGRSPFYSIAQLAAGHLAYLQGDLDDAVTLFTRAAQNDAAPAIIRMRAMSCWSWAEEEVGHQQLSMALAVDAMGIVEAHRLGTMLQASFAHTALGRAQMTGGDLRAAEITIEQGMALLRRNPNQGPWANIHHLMAAARLAAAKGELLMAQHLADEASLRIRRFPDGMEFMVERLHTIERQIRAIRDLGLEREPLTERELEILRLLQGSLSLSEIARELYISPNTVKTHAKSVYRKLHASSRAEAVRIARSRLLV